MINHSNNSKDNYISILTEQNNLTSKDIDEQSSSNEQLEDIKKRLENLL